MKLSSLLISGVCLLLFSFSTFAQDFEVPGNVTLEKKEDYAKYEQDVIKAARWLEATEVGREMDKRKSVNVFVLQWISGSPTVAVELSSFVGDLYEKNPQFLGMFMAGYTRWVLENNYSKDVLKANTAGVQSVINLYNLGGEVKRNKFLLKAIDADNQNRLEEFIKGKLPKQ